MYYEAVEDAREVGNLPCKCILCIVHITVGMKRILYFKAVYEYKLGKKLLVISQMVAFSTRGPEFDSW